MAHKSTLESIVHTESQTLTLPDSSLGTSSKLAALLLDVGCAPSTERGRALSIESRNAPCQLETWYTGLILSIGDNTLVSSASSSSSQLGMRTLHCVWRRGVVHLTALKNGVTPKSEEVRALPWLQ
jgi:hypothetical protein